VFANTMKYVYTTSSANFGNMLSMALLSLAVPFLPLLPKQILLNNFLYDLSEIAIPYDTVEEETLARPCVWDIGFVRRFMLALGPVSSVFDFLTFFVLLRVFHAGEALFHTGWFVESLATQVLVIFIIRTRGNPLAHRPGRWLVGLALAVVGVAALLPFTPAAPYLGFVAPPPGFYLVLAGILAVYLACVQVAKELFYRRQGTGGR
jgi:Mg2+-importing ATPase